MTGEALPEAGGTTVRLSVVVATYNRGELILPTIRSALAQSYPAHEIIVVGDGCTDRTGEILAGHFGDRVIWRNLGTNGGSQSFGNNEGIRLATGTHIAYLGHDDIWSPKHLSALARVFETTGADVAVSGAILHAPAGCDLWNITGIFDNPAAPQREFFPPSSVAHRRDLTDRIGPWAEPRSIKGAVDWEMQDRALAAGCRYASTGRVTVHKFVAGYRYLSYRFPSAQEQIELLENLADPDFEATLLGRILTRVAHGGVVVPLGHIDGGEHAPGVMFRLGRSVKGLDLGPPKVVERTTQLEMDDAVGGFDWHRVDLSVQHGPYRWASRNPNPVWLVNARIARPFSLRVPIVAVADAGVMASLKPLVNDKPAGFTVTDMHDGGYVLEVTADVPLPAEGVKLTFQTWVPGTPLPPVRERRFALGRITVVLDDPFARALRRPAGGRRPSR